MKVYKVKRLWGNITGITLYPIGIFIREDKYCERLLKHEKSHWEQQSKRWYSPFVFYPRYLIEGLLKGYKNISYEIEANIKENEK